MSLDSGRGNANSTQKERPARGSNTGAACYEMTVLSSTTPCHGNTFISHYLQFSKMTETK